MKSCDKKCSRSLVDMFDERETNEMIRSLYKRANAEKACRCNSSNPEVDELKAFTNPAFKWCDIKQSLNVDSEALENAKFYKEVIAFAKYVAQKIIDQVPFEDLCNTTNIAKIKTALCTAIRIPNEGSVMAILFIWCCARGKDLAIHKESRKTEKEVVEEIEEFLDGVLDTIGKTFYAGMVNIVKSVNPKLYATIASQKDTVKYLIGETLLSLYNTYKNADIETIAEFYSKYIMTDKDTFRNWVSFMYKLKEVPYLAYVSEVNDYVMKKLYKKKLSSQKHDNRNILYRETQQLGGFTSFARINEEEDFEAVAKGLTCKGANALDELFGNKKTACETGASALLDSLMKSKSSRGFL